jgi:hypothetical protein
MVEYVYRGDKTGIHVPALSTERVGRARFRGVRFVHTHTRWRIALQGRSYRPCPFTVRPNCLCLLRGGGEGLAIHIGHLIPQNKKGQAWDFIGPVPVQELDLDFTEFITELENEFVKERGKHYILDKDRERCVLISVSSQREQRTWQTTLPK